MVDRPYYNIALLENLLWDSKAARFTLLNRRQLVLHALEPTAIFAVLRAMQDSPVSESTTDLFLFLHDNTGRPFGMIAMMIDDHGQLLCAPELSKGAIQDSIKDYL